MNIGFKGNIQGIPRESMVSKKFGERTSEEPFKTLIITKENDQDTCKFTLAGSFDDNEEKINFKFKDDESCLNKLVGIFNRLTLMELLESDDREFESNESDHLAYLDDPDFS